MSLPQDLKAPTDIDAAHAIVPDLRMRYANMLDE